MTTVYAGTPFDVAAMRAMRERQLRHLVTPGTVNAKYSQGGLAELEYIVQGLQITHGAADPSLRVTNTAEAIARLAAAGVISAENGARLGDALLFLHQLINALRMVRGNTRDLTVPAEESEEFAYLARRLGYGNDPNRLGVAISEHMTWVQRLGAQIAGVAYATEVTIDKKMPRRHLERVCSQIKIGLCRTNELQPSPG